jgi:hypothetical protein
LEQPPAFTTEKRGGRGRAGEVIRRGGEEGRLGEKLGPGREEESVGLGASGEVREKKRRGCALAANMGRLLLLLRFAAERDAER